MSKQDATRPTHEEEEDEPQLNEEDIVEVHEDDDDQPMDDDDDEDHAMDGQDDDEDNSKYDGEIVIGAPQPGEEEALAALDDNTLGATSLHSQSVFTLSVHPLFPNPPLAVSGGEDDLGYLFCPIPSAFEHPFNSDTYQPTKLTGHTDSVVATGWSFDGEMVSTGGMDGRVRIWRRVKRTATGDGGVGDWKDWEFLTSLDTGSEITWLSWHPKGNVLAAGCEDATVWLWNLPSGQTMTVLTGHTLPTTAGAWLPSGKTLLTVSADSTLIHWDPRSSQPLFKSSIFTAPNNPDLDPEVHGITTLAVAPNGQIAACGSGNGLVKTVNLANGNVVGRLTGHNEGESVEALVFVDVLGGQGGGKGVVLVSGGTDGKGFVWDLATGRVRAELKHDEPITSLAAHPSPSLHLVTSGSADASLKTWDIRTGTLIRDHKGHQAVVNDVAVGPSPDGHGQVIMSASDDGASLLWKV